jgi:replication initiation protein RepC
MNHLSTTPFGRRPVTAADLSARNKPEGPLPASAPDKWTILKDLTDARRALGLSDRTLAVLSALLSFHPERTLDTARSLIVHPSNMTLSARAHGMPESTLRRHLSALTRNGLILRHDSPNGKRYVRRNASGRVDTAFGFDLAPLAHRAAELAAKAETARAEAARLKRLRETATLHLRDAAKLIALAQAHDIEVHESTQARMSDLARRLRRKMDMHTLEGFLTDARTLLGTLNAALHAVLTHESSADDAQNERHIQDSDTLPSESEDNRHHPVTPETQPLHLDDILTICPSLALFSPESIDKWPDLIRAADAVRPMLGITDETWRHARRSMGPAAASTTLACILESSNSIRNPGGYLRRLAQKAELRDFTPVPMLASLRKRHAARLGASETDASRLSGRLSKSVA